MKITKAQRKLIKKLRDGCEVTLHEGYYSIVKNGQVVERVWPSTFHGLFVGGVVVRAEHGNYVLSDYEGGEAVSQQDQVRK